MRLRSGPARRRATYQALVGVPEHLVAEIIDGELVTSPRPAAPHARAASTLSGELYNPFDRGKVGPGGWLILYEPELHLHGSVLVPDLAGWRRERMPEMPDAAAFELAPDWVCEILSSSTAPVDRADKIPIYLRESVKYVWLVDPALRNVVPAAELLAPGVRRRARVVVDDRSIAVEAGWGKEEIDAELGEVLSGPEARTESEVTVHTTVGLPFQELLAAWQVFESARENPELPRLELGAEPRRER